MEWQAWFTLGMIGLVIGALATNRIGVDVVMAGGLTLLLLFDIIPLQLFPIISSLRDPRGSRWVKR